jgi:hypothetical protein
LEKGNLSEQEKFWREKICWAKKVFPILNTVGLLEFTIDSSYFSSSFQEKIFISVAASPLNKGWFKIQQKTRAPYSLQFLGLPYVQSSSFGTENCKL